MIEASGSDVKVDAASPLRYTRSAMPMRPMPLRPSDSSALAVLIWVFAAAGLVLTGLALAATVAALPTLPTPLPAPLAQFEPLPTLTPGPTSMAAGESPTPLLEEPTLPPVNEIVPPVVNATSPPKPTRVYVAPPRPTPKPTPELPPAAPFPTSCDGPGRMNILLIGIDTRTESYFRASRADAVGVLGVNFADKTAQILFIPRDLFLPIPGLEAQKIRQARINAAYAYGEYYQVPGGGPGLVAATISQNFGLRIDRYVVVNFAAFEDAVDAIAGIDVDVPTAIYDPKFPVDKDTTMVVHIPAGHVHMDGATALIYARTRHQDNDFNRMRRQQAVLMAIRDRLLSPEVLPNLPALAQVLVSSARTDMALEDIGLIGCAGPQVGADKITRILIDDTMTAPTTLSDGAQVYLPVWETILPALEAFNTGQ